MLENRDMINESWLNAFEAIGDGLCILDRSFRIVWANQAIYKRSRLKGKELVGRLCYEVFKGKKKVCDHCPTAKVFQTGEAEELIDEGEGDHFYHITSSPVMGKDGKVKYAIEISKDISDLIQLRKKLQESETKYKRIFETSQQTIFVTDKEGFFLDINRAGLDLLGLTRKDELIGQHVKMAYVHPEDRKRFVKNLKKRGKVRQFETQFKRKDGSIRDVVLSGYIHQDSDGKILGYEGIVTDITELKRLQRELKRAAKDWRQTFDSMIDAVVIVDENKTIKKVNKAGARFFGEKPKKLIGKACFSVIYGKERPCEVCPHQRLLERGGSEVWDEYIPHLNKTFLIAISPVIEVEEDRRYTHFVHVFRDIGDFMSTKLKLKKSQLLLEQSFKGITMAMAKMVEERDPYTSGHGEKVALLTEKIGQEIGLSDDTIEGLRVSGILHDIGKISIPSEILNKTKRLNDLEYAFIKLHPISGYEILKNIRFPWPVATATRQHHERLDGSGYPDGLKDHEIIMEARVLSVADVVDAMASHRPYRPALGTDEALEEIKQHKGTLYDPKVVDACIRLFKGKGFKL